MNRGHSAGVVATGLSMPSRSESAAPSEGIPWLARCLAVAVHLVEKPVPHPAALEHLLAQAGRTLDPAAVKLFFRIPNLVGDA
jgi:hypothetical protein